MFGKCKVCIEKEARIQELKDQVLHLRTLVYPVQDNSTNYSDPFEDDISPKRFVVNPEESKEVREELHKEDVAVAEERDRLLSGNY